MVDKIERSLPANWTEGKNFQDFKNAVVQELDIAISYKDELYKQVYVSTATGQYLDDIGKIFRLSRKENESDDSFRARIMAFWPGFSGSGTIDDIKETINRLTGISKDDITITEIYSNYFDKSLKIKVEFSLSNLDLAETVKDVVSKSKAAGTYAFFQINPLFEDNVSITDDVIISIAILFRKYGEFTYGELSAQY